MASMSLWGMYFLLGVLVLPTSGTDLFPNPRIIRNERGRRQMMLVPSFVKQAATPTLFFMNGNAALEQRRRPVMDQSTEAVGSSEEVPPRGIRPMRQEVHATPGRGQNPQFRANRRPDRPATDPRDPFGIAGVAATPERNQRPQFTEGASPEVEFHRVPPTFFINDDIPFPAMFEVPPRQFHQPNPPPPRRPFQQPPPSQQFRSPTTTPRPSHQLIQIQPQPQQTIRQHNRPQPSQQLFRPQETQFAPRPVHQLPPTRTTRPTPPQAPPQQLTPQRVSRTRILPSVLDSLQQKDISVFIPGEAGRDYPVFADAPRTHFECSEEMFSTLIADVETKCQVVRVCRDDGGLDNFLCPNGTLFDEEAQFCNWWYRVPCAENVNSNHLLNQGRVIAEANADQENSFEESPQRPVQQSPEQQRPVQQRPVQQRPVQQRPEQQRPEQQRPEQQRPEQQHHSRPNPEIKIQESSVHVRPNGDGRGQSGFQRPNPGLDGFFVRPDRPLQSQLQPQPPRDESSLRIPNVPQTPHNFQQTSGVLRGNLDNFFGISRPNVQRPLPRPPPETPIPRPPSETPPASSEEREPLVITTTILPSSELTKPTRRPSLLITTRPHATTRLTKPPRTRRPFPSRTSTVIDAPEVGGDFGAAFTDDGVRTTTRRTRPKLRNRGRLTPKPTPKPADFDDEIFYDEEHEIKSTPFNSVPLVDEFDPFFEDPNPILEEPSTSTTTEAPTTTTKRKFKTRRTTTTTAKPTTKRTTSRSKLRSKTITPTTSRFRFRTTTRKSTRKPRVKPTTTTKAPEISEEEVQEQEEPIPIEVFTPEISVPDLKNPLPLSNHPTITEKEVEVQHFTEDPFAHLKRNQDMFLSPFLNPVQVSPAFEFTSTPVNFDPFYFGPAVTRDLPPPSLEELPIAGFPSDDTLEENFQVPTTPGPISTSTVTTIELSTEPKENTIKPKLRTASATRKDKSKQDDNNVGTSTSLTVSVSEGSTSTVTSKPRSKGRTTVRSRTKSRSKSRSRSRSRNRSKPTTTTVSPDEEGIKSTERIFATPKSRAQLFPTRSSKMRKTTFGQKKTTESSSPETTTISSNTTPEEAQESNTITIIETTPTSTTNTTV